MVYVVIYTMPHEGDTLVLVTTDREKAVDVMFKEQKRLKNLAEVRIEVWDAVRGERIEPAS